MLDNSTCVICGSDMQTRRKCFSCGRIVCRNCCSMRNGVFICHRCTGEKKQLQPADLSKNPLGEMGIGKI